MRFATEVAGVPEIGAIGRGKYGNYNLFRKINGV